MKTDKSQDKYSEIFQELREEKMNWDFEDFLAEAEKEEEKKPVIKISEKKSASFPKFYWMAASVVLLVSVGLFFNNADESHAIDQNTIVQNEIIRQKEDFGKENQLVTLEQKDSLKTDSDTLPKDSVSVTKDYEVMNKILPKRGRLKRQTRTHYVQNTKPEKSAPASMAQNTDYESNYVIINGQKIENEQEAIDLAKYSFRILSENVTKTVAQTDVLQSFTSEQP